MKKIFWLVGDKSGDLHAANVIEQVNKIDPSIEHIGIGGPNMLQHGFKALFPFERFNVMGFHEIIKHLPFFMKVEKEIKKFFLIDPPELVILVDYPGLNFRIADIAYNLHIKILYYVVPQFWAWRHNRIYHLRRFCDYIACIFPFEKEILDIHGIASSYVGHPVVEEVKYQVDKEEFARFYNLDIDKKWISFFPGSRASEVHRLLPIYLKTIKKLKNMRPDCEFLISKSMNISRSIFQHYLKDNNDIKLIDGYRYEMMKYSDFLVVKSGTTTVEAAFIGTPFIIVYKTSPLSYQIAKRYIRVKYIGMPNIILDKPIIPELIQSDVNPDNIIKTILFYLEHEKEYQAMSIDLKGLQEHLSEESASKNVAEIVLKMI